MTAIRITILTVAAVLSHSANAATQTYTNYNAFVGATAGLAATANALAGIPAPMTLESGDIVNGVDYAFNIYNRTNPNLPNGTTGQVAQTGGRNVLSPLGLGTSFQPGGLSNRNDTVTLTFSSPLTAFGVSLSIAPSSTFSITTDTGPTASTASFTSYGEQTATYADYFLGLVSDTPFSSITLSGGNRYMGGTVAAWSGWTATRISYAAPVPLPASWLLFLGGLGFATRRRKPRLS